MSPCPSRRKGTKAEVRLGHHRVCQPAASFSLIVAIVSKFIALEPIIQAYDILSDQGVKVWMMIMGRTSGFKRRVPGVLHRALGFRRLPRTSTSAHPDQKSCHIHLTTRTSPRDSEGMPLTSPGECRDTDDMPLTSNVRRDSKDVADTSYNVRPDPVDVVQRAYGCTISGTSKRSREEETSRWRTIRVLSKGDH